MKENSTQKPLWSRFWIFSRNYSLQNFQFRKTREIPAAVWKFKLQIQTGFDLIVSNRRHLEMSAENESFEKIVSWNCKQTKTYKSDFIMAFALNFLSYTCGFTSFSKPQVLQKKILNATSNWIWPHCVKQAAPRDVGWKWKSNQFIYVPMNNPTLLDEVKKWKRISILR